LALGEREVIQRLSSALDLQHRLVRGQGSQRLGDQRLSHYRFRHILFQRYVYNSLDEVQRVYLHETVGQVLERLYGDQTEEIAGQLARHFQAAGLVAKAIDYLRQAGERAVRLSANQEAIVHFSQALALLDSFPDTPKRARQELDLRVALSPALVATKGYAAPAVGQNYTRARELCQQVEETPQLFPVLHGLLRFYLVRAEYRTASELGQHFLNLVQPTQDPALLLEAHRALGTSAFHLGDLALSQAHLQQGLALYDSRRHRAHAVLYGVDPGVICLSYTAWTLWLAGYPDRALEKGHEALSRARRLSNPHTLAAALTFAAILFHFRREAKVAQERAEAALTLATEQGFSFWLAWGTIWQGWAMADQGEFGAGITRIHQGLDTSRATGAETMRMYFLSLLAETYLKAEQVEKGLAVLAEALAVPDERRERWWEAELYRLRGELLREQDAAETGAEACFRQAVDIARQQGARSLELRATVGLSRLWHRQGQKEEARQVLAEIYNWFTEGFDTPDLIEAKSLLEECQSG
jgi:predicted ATPase